MGYKRTSKKTGPNSRRTQTFNNKNSSVTNTYSTGNKNFRTTYSNNSKTGNRVTQTWRDGAGFTHRKIIYSTAGANREIERQRKRAVKFWAGVFGTNKPKARRSKSQKDAGSSFGVWILLIIALITCVMIFH